MKLYLSTFTWLIIHKKTSGYMDQVNNKLLQIRWFVSTNQTTILLWGIQIVIPTALQKEMLMKLCTGHLVITKCQERAKQCVWWPRIGKHIEEEAQKCLVYSQFCHQKVEPLQHILLTNFPDYPWQRVAANFFAWKDNYLILVDFYFHYIKMSNKMKFYNFICSDTIH